MTAARRLLVVVGIVAMNLVFFAWMVARVTVSYFPHKLFERA